MRTVGLIIGLLGIPLVAALIWVHYLNGPKSYEQPIQLLSFVYIVFLVPLLMWLRHRFRQ